jgi:hypothetical protein
VSPAKCVCGGVGGGGGGGGGVLKKLLHLEEYIKEVEL